ncbi:MAG: histidine phosphatase family protein [Armatimonadetes bacterium]|nr:histidine phosphatase family protein [Armatimonadota bacterium]
MGTTFLLIRHASHDLLGRALTGRMPGVSLNAQGRAESESLAERLSALPIRAVYASPLERARETAAPLAERLGLPVHVAEEIGEIDYGEWTGRPFEALNDHPKWSDYNSFRSGTRIPGGEMMLEAQARIVTFMERLRERHPDQAVALVGHGDVLKSAVAYFLGAPLDLFQRIEIGPATVSAVELNDWGPRVLCVNHAGPLPEI